MSFKFVKSLCGENFPIIRAAVTTASTAIAADAAVVLTAGKTVLAGATAKPVGIAANAVASAASPADTMVQAVLAHQVWETTFAADPAAINEGDKVTLHTDAAQVTATTASGVATVFKKLGTGIGSKVWVRFE